MEKMAETANVVVFKDYAHSPSKVQAAVRAVKNQYPNRKLLACLELHTYSSLSPEFLKEYRNTMDVADKAVVFYSPNAVMIKQLDEIKREQIEEAFDRDDLVVFTNSADFKTYLYTRDYADSCLLLMSSGNYGGLDFDEIKQYIENA